MRDQADITVILDQASGGNKQAADELLALVYDQLRAVANAYMAREAAGHTMQATALVHEAFLKLVGRGAQVAWGGRAQFFSAAGEAMRRILIDHARTKKAAKRGGTGRRRIALDVVDLAAESDPDEIMALEGAFSRLEQDEPEVAAVVRLRFYAGLSGEDAALALGISPRQVDRLWAYARAFLVGEIERAAGS